MPTHDEPGVASGASKSKRRRYPAVALSLAGHGAVLFAMLSVHATAPKEVEPPPIEVGLYDTLPMGPAPTPEPKAPAAKPAAAKPNPTKTTPTKTPPVEKKVHVVKARVPSTRSADDEDEPRPAPVPALTAAQLAGAATAESGGSEGGGGGGGGGACNMAKMLQAALRRDHLVQQAVSTAPGKALLVWNGDWVRTGAEDGKGLSAVREAMIWEIGFAPAACRSQPVHGLVVLAMGDHPGATRLAVGGGEWRWSDLLHPRRTMVD